jgi:hypothetical protein
MYFIACTALWCCNLTWGGTVLWDVTLRSSLNCTDFWRNLLPLSVTQCTLPAGSSETLGPLSPKVHGVVSRKAIILIVSGLRT